MLGTYVGLQVPGAGAIGGPPPPAGFPDPPTPGDDPSLRSCISPEIGNKAAYSVSTVGDGYTGTSTSFSDVVTPYGDGIRISNNSAGVATDIYKQILSGDVTYVAFKFRSVTSPPDDNGALILKQGFTTGSFFALIPGREASYDALKRPQFIVRQNTSAAWDTVKCGASALTLGQWYSFVLQIVAGVMTWSIRTADTDVLHSSGTVAGAWSPIAVDTFSLWQDGNANTGESDFAALRLCGAGGQLPPPSGPATITAAAGTVTVGASVSMGGTMGPVPAALFTVGLRPKGGAFGQSKTLAHGAAVFEGEILAPAAPPGGPGYTVDWETFDIASVDGVNYTAASGTVSGAAGVPQPISVTVVPAANFYGAPGCIFGVRIKNPTGRPIMAGADDVAVTVPVNLIVPTISWLPSAVADNFNLFADYEFTLSQPLAVPETFQYFFSLGMGSPGYPSGSILSSEYSVDGGASYHPLGPAGGGSFVLPAMTSSFRIRQNTTAQTTNLPGVNEVSMGLFSPIFQFNYQYGPFFYLPIV